MVDRQRMDVTKMTDFTKLEIWLNAALQRTERFDSIHFDEFWECNSFGGDVLVSFASQVVSHCLNFLQKFASGYEVRFVVVYLSAGITEEVEFWSENIIQRISGADEPPTLYLLRSEHVFDEESEEYRVPVELNIVDLKADCVIFRSFRDRESIEKSWEFNSGLYFIAKI